MTPNRKHFKVGEIECIALNDGAFTYPMNWIFSNVAQEELEGKLRERKLPVDQVETPYICLLVKSGKHRVLIDTGAGAIAPTTGELPKSLAAEKIRAEEITYVILTHGHPDHIGGVVDGEGKPAFANAQHVMAKTEWDFWKSPDMHGCGVDDHMKQILAGCAEKNLPPLKERLTLIEGEKEIIPGVRVIPVAGHTPGHMGVMIASGKEQLFCVSDAALHPLNLEHPKWRNAFDLDGETAAVTRQKLFDRAATDEIKVLAYHFPFPGLGRVERSGGAWRWQNEA
jgi:glyoxylase-like metal-dependent hydrolase (beta-lactamase superfamily II)